MDDDYCNDDGDDDTDDEKGDDEYDVDDVGSDSRNHDDDGGTSLRTLIYTAHESFSQNVSKFIHGWETLQGSDVSLFAHGLKVTSFIHKCENKISLTTLTTGS